MRILSNYASNRSRAFVHTIHDRDQAPEFSVLQPCTLECLFRVARGLVGLY
jgi:hypothetical protein